MSSLFAHLAAGATVYACAQARLGQLPRRLLPACAVLAVLPDLDYVLWWWLRVNLEPRPTHSLAFALATAAAAMLLLRLPGRPAPPADRVATALALAAAALSHLVLDFLVGVHPLPLLWPLSDAAVAAPQGVLPSAGRLDLANAYLWRNLLIEAGVLGPVFAAAWLLCRRAAAPALGLAPRLLVLVAWLGFVGWSVSLQR